VLPRPAATHPVFDFHTEGAGAGSGAGCSLGLSFLTSQSGSRLGASDEMKEISDGFR
jgi:hypothetical protein